MDFEIEGSEDESYHYESYSAPTSYSSGQTLGRNPPKKSSTYFGGGDEDDNAYDFEYEEPPAPKAPNAGHFSAFSPEAKTRKSFGGGGPAGKAANHDASTDYSEEESSGYHPTTKTNTTNNNNNLRLSVQSNESALERAQNMLNKYNNTGKSSAPSSNFKGKRIPTTFDEDDLSMEEELDDSQAVDMSDSMDQSSGMRRSGTSTNLHKKPSSNTATTTTAAASSKAPASKANAGSKPMKFQDESGMSNIMGEESVEDVYSEDEDIIVEEEAVEEDDEEDPEEEYGNEDFDDADELGESIAHDDDEYVKPKRSAPVTKAAPVAKKQQESEDESEHEEQVNHSYSRMMYGPEDGIDSDEVDEDVNDSSKPKIFSFAELGDIAGWEPSSSNIANKSDFQYPELPAKPVSSQPKTSSATETKTSSISIAKSTAPSAEAKSEVKTIVPTQKSAAPVPAQPVPAPVVPTNYPPQEVPSSSAQPNYGHHPTQQAPPPAYQQPHQQPLPHYPPQYQQPPQHYPYAYPPAPPSAGDANNAAHQPPPPPYGYPQYPPYHHMPHSPHMPPYGYPPYGYSYPPMPHMPYAPYPYPPMYHYPPVDGMGAMNQQAAMLASMSASSSLLANKSVGSSSTPMVSQMQNQPIILELLQELSKVQEEANWARKKLAETIIMLNQNNGSTRGSVEVQTPALALPKSNHGGDNTKGRYDQEDDEDDYEDDEVDDSNEYSEDFELSNLNLSTSFRKPPSVKGKAKKTFPNETFKKVEQKPVEATKDEEKTLPSPTENISPPYLPKQSENVRFSQDLHSDGNKVRGLGIPSFTTTNEFLDPFTDSVARSFLASQELLRSKLETLRLRVQMTNSMATERQELENFSMGMSTPSQATGGSSLDRLKSQFETKRKQSEDRLIKLLKEAYPNLDEAEALKMSKIIE